MRVGMHPTADSATVNDAGDITGCAEAETFIVYFQCSDCFITFSDETSHENHICSAKSLPILIAGDPVSLSQEDYKSLLPDSILPNTNKSPLSLMKEAVQSIGGGYQPINADLSKEKKYKEKREKFLSSEREGINKLRVEREIQERERKRGLKLKNLLTLVCSKCKKSFKEPTLNKEHTYAKGNSEEKEEEKLSSSDKGVVCCNSKLKYLCSRCQVTFIDLHEFKLHPCFWEKGDPIVRPVESSNTTKEVAAEVENPSSSKVSTVSEEVVSPDKLLNSTIVKNKISKISDSLTEKETEGKEQDGSVQPKKQVLKTWKCPECNKSFRGRSYFNYHNCNPTGVKKKPLPYGALGKPPYTCTKCGIVFKHKTSFSRHIHYQCKMVERPKKNIQPIVTRHPVSSERKRKRSSADKAFQCTVCSKGFNQKYYLIHHSCEPVEPFPSGSFGGPPFLCPSCGVTYKHKQSYSRHIHHECGKGRKFFKTYSGKYVGKKKEKKKAPDTSVCILCQTSFPDETALQAHVQTDHLSLY